MYNQHISDIKNTEEYRDLTQVDSEVVFKHSWRTRAFSRLWKLLIKKMRRKPRVCTERLSSLRDSDRKKRVVSKQTGKTEICPK